MARGKFVEEQVRVNIRDLLLQNNKLSGKELQQKVEKEPSGIKYTVRTYQNLKKQALPVIAKIKAIGLDKPWNLGILNNPNIPKIDSEAIPYILLVQDWMAENKDPLIDLPFGPLTIRQALWVSRLYALVHFFKDKPDLNVFAKYLWMWSQAYSRRELNCYLLNVEVDTSELDKGLRERALPIVMGNTISIHYPKSKSNWIDTSCSESGLYDDKNTKGWWIK